MEPLKLLYRRLDRLQRGRWFRFIASVVALALCAAVFGSLLVTSYGIQSQRRTLVEALQNQNASRGDQHALSLRDRGEVIIGGRTYTIPQSERAGLALLDQDGNLVAPPVIADLLLQDQRPTWAPDWLFEQPGTTWLLALIVLGWMLLVIWLELALPLALTLLATGVCVLLAGLLGGDQARWALGGMGLLTFTFVLLTRTFLLLYSRPNQVFAVAHTVLKEASRTRIALVFIVVILIMLPLLPLGLDADSPLRFRIQTYISRSLGFTFYLAACMTLFLSCATVAFEIRDRQIWQLMTKPLGRFNYLVGKWLGVMLVNLILLAVSGVSIFMFVQYLRTLPTLPGEAGMYDRLAVENEVLTARAAARPVYQILSPEQVRARVDRIIEDDEKLSAMQTVPVSRRQEIERELQQQFLVLQRSVPPWDSNTGYSARQYTFRGLKGAKSIGATLTLNYRFHILGDDDHLTFHALFVFNDDPSTQRQARYVPTMRHSIVLGPDLIRDDGTLRVAVVNMYQPPSNQRGVGSLNFEAEDFELLFTVGSFPQNFLRAVLVTWVKLAFLAAVGVCCATFLSFPVACLLSFTLFIGGSISPFLQTALDWYYPTDTADMNWSDVGMVVDWLFESCTRWIALAIVYMLKGFGEYQPTQDLVQGRIIPWSSVATGLVKLGALWSGCSMAVGYLVIRNRQLAIYSGHG